MLKVQKELVGLKQKANEQELKEQQEAKISGLEHKIRELRTDCIKLSDECDKQSKVIGKVAQFMPPVVELKEKKKELEDDRRFLDFEIRDCREQNQSLKVMISRTHNANDDLAAQREDIASKYQSEISGSRGNLAKYPPLDIPQNSSYIGNKETEMTTNRAKGQEPSTARDVNTFRRMGFEDNNMLLEAHADLEDE
jgi:DNA repair exonuclease SbcCD ATPase subunit